MRGGAPSPALRSGSPAHGARDPRRGAAAWQLSGALLLVLAIAIAGLHVLFDGQGWWFPVVFVVTIVLAAAATTRSLARSRVLPTVVSAVVLIGAMTLFFAPTSALLGVIPTFDTLARFDQLVGAANESIYRQAVPADADAAIVFCLAFGLGAVAVVCDLVVLTLRRPAFAGAFVLGILAIPAFTLADISDPVIFVLTVAAFLFLLQLGSPRRQPGLAAGIGATAIVGTLVLPVVLPPIDTSIGANNGGPSSGINPVLDLGDDLRRASARTVLDYTTESGAGHYLRLVSLDDFTGDEWAPTERETDTDNAVDDFGPVPGLADDVPIAAETTSIDVRNLTSKWLPVPYPARSIAGLENDWYFDAEGFSVSSPDDTPRGQDYEVRSVVLQPGPDQLLAAGTEVAEGLERYAALPEDLPPVIAETAASVVGAAPTNYEKAIALQEYFRSPQFTYSEEAPVQGDYDGTGMDLIAEFLGVKAGYCVHFSSSMAVMARTLGIPSRVIVGFLPGSPDEENGVTRYVVDTHDLHAWPELYFEGIGWVQFEPTPGRGELGDYADVTNAGVPAPITPDEQVEPTAPAASPSPTLSTGPDNAQDPGGGSTTPQASVGPAPWIALGIVGAFLLSLVPAVIRAGQRRRLAARLHARTASAIDAWREVLRTAVDFGAPVTPTETPRGTAGSLGVRSTSLSRILAATEEKGYAATTIIDQSALVDDVEQVRRAISADAPARLRLLGTLYPKSIWRRIVHPFGSSDTTAQ